METYRTVRQRLDLLGYREAFSADVLPLVQRLLQDLARATDACRGLKQANDALEADKVALDERLHPLRSEITQLTLENNQLHQDLITASDRADDQACKTAIVIRTLENEISDLKFLNSQVVARVHIEQGRREEERQRVDELMRKMKNANFKTHNGINGVDATSSAGDKKNTNSVDKLFRRIANIELQTGLDPIDTSDINTAVPFIVRPDPDAVDVLKITEARLKAVQDSQADLERCNNDLEVQLQLMREQIHTREQEIVRLGNQLELSKASKVYSGLKSALRTRNQCNYTSASPSSPIIPKQVESLNESSDDNRIEQLESQIDFMQDTILTLEQRLASGEKNDDRKIAAARNECDSLLAELQQIKAKNTELTSTLTLLETQLSKPQQSQDEHVLDRPVSKHSTLSTKSAKTTNADDANLLDDMKEELQAMTDLLATANEQHSNLRKENEVLQQKQKMMQTRCDQLEREVQSIRAIAPVANILSLSRNGQKSKSQLETLEAVRWSMERELATANAKLATVAQLHATIETQRNELSRLSEEIRNAEGRQTSLNSLNDIRERERSELLDRYNRLEEVLEEVTQQRDALAKDLKLFEQETRGLDDRMREIVQERDRYRAMYDKLASAAKDGLQSSQTDHENSLACIREEVEQKNTEIKKLEHDLEKKQHLQEQLNQIIEERDRAQLDVLNTKHELSVIVNQLHQSDQQSTEQALENVTHQNVAQEMMERLSQLEQTCTQLKQTNLSLQADISNARADLDAAKATNETLQKKISKQAAQLNEGKSIIEELQQALDTLRDQLSQIEQSRIQHHNNYEQAQSNYCDSQQELQECQAMLRSITQEVERFQRECARLKSLVFETQQEKQLLANDLQRQQQDLQNKNSELYTTTSANDALSSELKNLTAERAHLAHQCDDFQQKVDMLTQLLRNKDTEREDIIDNYRRLLSDQERAEANLKATAKEVHSLRTEIILKNKDVSQLQTALEDATINANQCQSDLTKIQQECENLTKSLHSAEWNLKQLETDKIKALREVSGSREVAMHLGKAKDELYEQVCKLLAENDKNRETIHKFRVENESLSRSINVEQANVENLDKGLAQERTVRLRSERQVKELSLQKRTLESRFEEVGGTKAPSVTKLLDEVRSLIKEKTMLQTQALKLEAKVSTQDADIMRYRDECDTWRSKLHNCEEELKRTEKIIDDIMNTQHTHIATETPNIQRTTAQVEEPTLDRTQFEKKIGLELQATQRKLKRYESRIAKQTSPGAVSMRKPTSPFDFSAASSHESSFTSDARITEELIQSWQKQNRAMRKAINGPRLPHNGNNVHENKYLLQTISQLKKDLSSSTSTPKSSSYPYMSSSGSSYMPTPSPHTFLSHSLTATTAMTTPSASA